MKKGFSSREGRLSANVDIGSNSFSPLFAPSGRDEFKRGYAVTVRHNTVHFHASPMKNPVLLYLRGLALSHPALIIARIHVCGSGGTEKIHEQLVLHFRTELLLFVQTSSILSWSERTQRKALSFLCYQERRNKPTPIGIHRVTDKTDNLDYKVC